MEELHSTEALDREILEDARKKAFKILKNADESVLSQKLNWEKKTQKDVEEIRKNYEQQTEKVREEIFARLPLDKRRLRSETSEFFLREAMENFLQNLNRDVLLLILENELIKRLDESKAELGKEGRVIFSSMNNGEVDKTLGNALEKIPFLKDWQINNWQKNEAKNYAASFPMIVIDTPSIRITVSVDDVASEFLKLKRAELTAALLGEGVLND